MNTMTAKEVLNLIKTTKLHAICGFVKITEHDGAYVELSKKDFVAVLKSNLGEQSIVASLTADVLYIN